MTKENNSNDPPMLDRIKQFLDKFEWKPEKIEESDSQYVITLLARLDIAEIKINIKFKYNPHWIFFSSQFLTNVERNHLEIYQKLLEINYATTLTKFGLSPKGAVYALTELPAKTMDYEEFISALRRLTNDINKYLLPVANIHRESTD